MWPRCRQLLEEGIALQERLAIPPRLRVIRQGRVPRRVERPEWLIHPPLREADLGALEVEPYRLPRQLAELYTEVGNGFRFGGQEVAAADQLVRAWREAAETARDDDHDPDDDAATEEDASGDAAAGVRLVPVNGERYDSIFFVFPEAGGCEVWKGQEDPVRAFGSPWEWLEHDLGALVRHLSQRLEEGELLAERVRALDYSRVHGLADLKAYFEVLYQTQYAVVREAGYRLEPLRLEKLRALVEKVRIEHLDRDLAESISYQLYDHHHWQLASSFLEKCRSLFPRTDVGSLTLLERLAVAYAKQGRPADALPYFAACVALGKSFHECNVAKSLLDLGRAEEAEHHLRACSADDTFTLNVQGRIEVAMGRPREAEAAFKRSIADQGGSFGKYAGPYLNLATLYLGEGRLEDAAHVLLPGDTPEANWLLGWLTQWSDYYQVLAELLERQDDHESARIARAEATSPHVKPFA